MREIKFRAWHEYGRSAKPATPGMVYDKQPGDCLTWLNQGQNITSIMQFTGLRDKAGREIYEGDVVKGTANPKDLMGLHDFIGIVRWDSEDTGFFYESEDPWPHIKPWFVNSIEVIGNVHENPELVNGE